MIRPLEHTEVLTRHLIRSMRDITVVLCLKKSIIIVSLQKWAEAHLIAKKTDAVVEVGRALSMSYMDIDALKFS